MLAGDFEGSKAHEPSGERAFGLDRVVALVFALMAVARTVNFLETYWSSWQRSLRRSSTMVFEWISAEGAWWSIVNILLVGAFSLWASRGVSRSRSSSFVVAGYLAAIDVTAQFGRHPSGLFVVHYGVPVYIVLFAYCGLRAVGTIRRRDDLRV